MLEMMLEQGKIRTLRLRGRECRPAAQLRRCPPPRHADAQYFLNYVKDQLVAEYGAGRVFGGAVGRRSTSTSSSRRARPSRRSPRNPDGPAAALVAIEPSTGAVKAMFGGRNFRESQFNLAAQAERQPGSAFKPIVLATAMREGISPQSEIESKKVAIDAGDRIWTVTNYDHTYLGRVSLARALVSSDNSVYAQLTDLVGPKIVQTAHALGIRSPLDAYFSIGLGSVAANPLEMARAPRRSPTTDGASTARSSAIARVVEQVERIQNDTVETNAPIPTQVLEDGQAELLTDILEDVVRVGTKARRDSRAQRRGQDRYDGQLRGRVVRRLHPQLVVAVWVGYPDRLRSMTTEFGGEPVTGGTLPAQIWKKFVETVEEEADASFDAPPYLGGVSTWVVKRGGAWTRDNGYCRDARLLVYFSGKGPEEEPIASPTKSRCRSSSG